MQTLLSFFSSFFPAFLSKSDGNLMDYIVHHIVDQNKWYPLPMTPWHVAFPSFSWGSLHFQNGLHAMMLLIAMTLLILVFGVFFKRKSNKMTAGGLSLFLEMLVVFVRDEICLEHLGKRDGKKLTPFFLTLFFFILTLNLMGLVPAFSTATANINITASFALITLTGMVVLGISKNGILGFLKAFIPSGLPIVIAPLIFVLELTGLVVKPFALTLRLFANMLAGHIIIMAITGVALSFGVSGLPLLLLTLFIYFLEILVAFLQAYIFTLLSAIFVGEILHPHH